ncbi:MAG: hypothetical protein JW769_04510 [Parachlamydiales bacterium]|nr:hypothetical protein [Parachlamydiales bacterium]
MKRTIALKLSLSEEQSNAWLETQKIFSEAYEKIVLFVVKNFIPMVLTQLNALLKESPVKDDASENLVL